MGGGGLAETAGAIVAIDGLGGEGRVVAGRDVVKLLRALDVERVAKGIVHRDGAHVLQELGRHDGDLGGDILERGIEPAAGEGVLGQIADVLR